MKLLKSEKTLSSAAAKAGMDEKTARKYRSGEKLPSQVKVEHNWRTRQDPFEDIWEAIEDDPVKRNDLRLRAKLMMKIEEVAKKRGLSRRDLEKILDEPQPRVSELMTGKINLFSVEKLSSYLERLGIIVDDFVYRKVS